MLKLWGRVNSINVQKVLWALEELKVPYERTDAGMAFGVVNEPFYKKMNPNSRVPTIDDDGFVLWESNAIIRYLAAKRAAASLWPDDLRIRAGADQWMDWQQTMFWPAIRPLFMGLIRTAPDKRDARAMEESRLKTAEVLRILDSQLKSRAYVAGDALTLGDIPLGCAIWRWMALPIDRPELPNVQRWFDSLARRPAYKTSVMLPLS